MPAQIGRPGGDTPIRSGSSASPGDKDVSIHRAQVVNVNTRDYTVDVRYEAYPYSTHFDIPWMVPYMHQNQGEGVSIMPEVGSTVWVCRPSESGRDAFVLGWTPVQESGTYRGGRELLNPGDIRLSTRDGNFLVLRRGGIVQIGSTPICQRLYIPIRNVIRDFAENYELTTPAGDLTWEVMREEDSGDGHQRCLYTLACKEFSDDPNTNPLAILKIGSHGDGNDTILTLETRDKGGGTIKTGLTISKSGKIDWKIQSDMTLSIKGNLSISTDQKVTVNSKQDIGFTSVSSILAKAQQITLTAGSAKLDMSNSASLNGTAVNLGDASGYVVIDNGSFAIWQAAVTAALTANPTSPPGTPVVKVLIPPLVYKSTKVRA